ncbi:MAG: glycosyltransferase family 39 protein [Gammaproteobacteria bacterium]|nr:glycosyltransferase family 39 protein [Gammaproteobacteria bacterium]
MVGARLPPDGYYYWDWSYHLALSYYDGPPLIAYTIKLFTLLFGEHEFTLYLIGLVAAALSGLLIHKLMRQLFDSKAADMALYIWLLTAGVVDIFFIEVSYNSLLIVFWAWTFYLFVQLQQSKRCYYYYLCGIAVGLMMLAKYNGIFLIISLFLVCLVDRRYRFILTSIHSYLAMLLALAIFSPVLIWNIQHHWLSIRFQLYHGFSMRHVSALQTIIYYVAINVLKWNFVFAALLYFSAHHYRQLWHDSRLRLLFIPTSVVWLFFLVSSLFSLPEVNWNSSFAFSAIMLVGYWISRPQVATWLQRSLLLGLGAVTLLTLLFIRFTLHLPLLFYWWGYSWGTYQLLNQLPEAVRHSPLPVFTSSDYRLPGYLSAFLANKRGQVYGLAPSTHQYYYWWQQQQSKIDASAGLYFSRIAMSVFPQPLKACKLINRQQYQYKGESKHNVWQLYVYHCTL